jgi:hypothetical protein
MRAEEEPPPRPPGDSAADARIEAWLRARRRRVVLGIAVVALVLRGFCFLELLNSPFVSLHEWDQTDMNTFHRWAQTIAGGDVWSRTVRPPLHSWHREIAADYARIFPDRWAELCTEVGTEDPDAVARRLWERWCGGGRTYQGPLYPYLVALTYRLLGASVVGVFLWQTALGVASTVLIYLLAQRLFGELAAVVAAGLALLYGPLMFYEFVLLRVTLIVFAGLLIVFQLERACESRRVLPWLWLGLMLGASVWLKVHFALMVVAVLALLVVRLRRQRDRLGPATAACVAGVLVGFSPVVVRNLAAGAPPLALASNGPATFLISNAGDVQSSYWGMRYAARILGETDSALLPTAVATLKTHPSLGSYLVLLSGKLADTWHWFEHYNNANFYYAQLHSPLLRSLPVSFGLIAPPAIIGLLLGLRRFGRRAALYCLVLANLAVVVFFFGFARFRLPLVAAVLPFAGFAVARLVGWLLTRRWVAAGAVLVACGGLSLWTMSPLTEECCLVRFADAEVGYRYYYHPLMRSALQQGDLASALQASGEALRTRPPVIQALGPSRPPRARHEAQLAALYATVHQRHAELLQQAGRTAEAEAHHRRSAELHHLSGGTIYHGPD